MKNLSFLRIVTKILYVIVVIAFVVTPAIVFLSLTNPGSIPEPLRLVEESDPWIISLFLMLSLFIESCLVVYALYLFRKVLKLFSRNILFDDIVIKSLKHIGWCLFAALLLEEVPWMIVDKFNGEEVSFDPLNTLFCLILSFFFIVLAEIFQKAKDMKEENELTV